MTIVYKAPYADAVISDCGRYRYRLTRTWDPSRESLVFVMLNPSTADAAVDDPTIRRCIGFARRDGYGGIIVVNLFAWRATDPADLPSNLPMRMGPDNRRYVYEAATGRDVILAWGSHSAAWPEVTDPLPERLWLAGARSIRCLGFTKSGKPRHPLYVRADQSFVPVTKAPEGESHER